MKWRTFAVGLAVFSLAPLCFAPPRRTLKVLPSSLTFGAQVIGTISAPQIADITATGAVGVTFKSFSSTGYYSQTNNCPVAPSLLNAKSSCQMNVTFAPPIIGPFNGTVQITDDAFGTPHVVMVSGVAVPPVAFSPASLSFGNTAIGSTSSSQSVTLTNNQSVGLTISGITASGNYSQTNNCPPSSTPLGSDQSCTINVKFSPTAKGSIPGAISVSTDASPGTQPIGLSGTGTGAVSSQIAISPATLDFGSQEAGTSSSMQTVTLTNSSNSKTLSITSVAPSSNVYQVSADSCSGQTIAAGGHCTFDVGFQPIAKFASVSYPGAITVNDSDVTSPSVVGLAGTGVPAITSSPATLDFGTIITGNSSNPQSVTLRNHHNASETLSISSSGYFPSVPSGSTCANPVAAGGTCSLQFAFNPRGIGTFIGAGTITPSSGGTLSPTVVSIAGCQTDISLSPPRLDFGMTNGPETATLMNLSSTTLDISGTPITGTNASDFAVTNNTCGSILASGLTCTLDLSFTPGASGTRNGTFGINDDGACNPQQLALIAGNNGPFITTVRTTGTGSGNVTSNPAGIDCGSANNSCSATYASGTSVTLTAVPDPGSMFVGWAQACSGTQPCTLNMAADRQVVATFNLLPVLNVTPSGNGAGTVTSSPAGINCGGTCSANYMPGTVVTLSQSAASGSTFTGWSGACSGTTTCVVTMNGDQSVTATFIAPDFSLSTSSPNPLNPGQSGIATVTVSSINNFANSVSLSCSVQALGILPPTCSINPTSVTPAANGSVNAQMILSTIGPSGSLFPVKHSILYAFWLPQLGFVLLGGGMLSTVSKRRLACLLLLGTVAAGFVFLQGCGRSNSTTSSSGTPAGAYTVTVNATSGSVQHATQLTLMVN
jgi:Divergent InlB B-repeat domain/Abnormal spindle-like microcephaly-assoc'd, ASPM-SPD-2-Hydin